VTLHQASSEESALRLENRVLASAITAERRVSTQIEKRLDLARRQFQQREHAFALQMQSKDAQIHTLTRELEHLRALVTTQQVALEESQSTLQAIFQSRMWRITNWFRQFLR